MFKLLGTTEVVTQVQWSHKHDIDAVNSRAGGSAGGSFDIGVHVVTDDTETASAAVSVVSGASTAALSTSSCVG